MKTYNLTLAEDQVKLYVAGLDSYIKLLATQIIQNNSPSMLQQHLPKLTEINQELQNLDKLMDEQDSKQ